MTDDKRHTPPERERGEDDKAKPTEACGSEEQAREPEPTSEVTELGEQYTVCEVNHPSMNEADQLTMF